MAGKEEDFDLAEYDSDDENLALTTADSDAKGKKAGGDRDKYVSVHSATFPDFLLKQELLRAITDAGFEHPSEVQHECIPQAVLGTDVICQAKSGMGKTLVFVLAVLHQLEVVEGEVSALVIVHTHELADQVYDEFKRFSKFLTDVKVARYYGGKPLAPQIAELRDNTPNIVIGTPGRIMHLSVESGALDLSKCKFFVLDECDQLLENLDMREHVQRIFVKTPHQKQVMMFSATLSDEVRPVCKRFMHNPLEIYVNDGSKLTLDGLQQYYVKLREDEKNRKLVDLMDTLEFNQLIIFVKSAARANELNKLLVELNFPSIVLHSGLRDKRADVNQTFKEFKARIMVATNLVGRGLDYERVNVVINYDMKETDRLSRTTRELADTYLHRVGRAGRFGTKGLTVSFISTDDDQAILDEVQNRFSVSIPELPDSIDASSYMTA